MDVTTWLTQQGFAEYIDSFIENEVDEKALATLTAEDLKDLGVRKIGHRRNLMNAIAMLSGANTQSDGPQGPATQGVAPDAPGIAVASRQMDQTTSNEAERRHLTVMFVDMVGSTELSTRIDAEDVRDVITGFQNTVAGVIGRFEGFVARFMGDGVLCYFGWPRANEDDAERAVRAGLSIIESVKKSSTPDGTPLATRIGIASGMVIVGDLIGSGASEEAAVVGETPNLAARLQSLAGPDQLVVPDTTRKLLNNAFVLESTGSHSLKGIAEPVEAFRVTAEATRISRFETHATDNMTPLVGRKQELELIRESWLSSVNGTGQMILVSGEAGIGKSRIVQAAIEEFKKNTPVRITFQCSPYHAESAFYPIIHQMQLAAGMSSTDTATQRLHKLEALPGVVTKNIPLLAAMVGIGTTAGFALPDLTPAQLRARTMDALLETLLKQASDKPVLVVFEDLHWIDPTTQEFLDLAIDSIGTHQIFILATARPTFVHGFGGHPDVKRFALNRLGRAQVLSIVEKLTDNKPVPEEVLQIIHERTDGVPLFVEELTKTILESGVLKDVRGQLVLDGPLNALAIPDTLHDSLMARLDRLQPIKEVAQMASCIGREFGHRLLMTVSPLPHNELNSALEGLIGAELIYRRGVPPEARYQFKHALVRDTAYESMLKPRRRAIHTAIMQALESESDVAPEVLATHAEAAGLTERAIDLWEAASKAAIARPAFDEAIIHLNHAIKLITPQVDAGDATVTNKALGLQVQLGVALMARKGWGAIETKTAFQDALTLADKVGETPLRFSILYGLMTARYVRADHEEAVRHGKEFVLLAEKSAETAPAVVANRSYAVPFFLLGQFDDAQPHFERALELFNPEIHNGLEQQYGIGLGVGSNSLLSLNLQCRGQTRLADTYAKHSEDYALASGHVGSSSYMLIIQAWRFLQLQNEVEFARYSTAAYALADEHGLTFFKQLSALTNALVAINTGEEQAIADFHKADDAILATRATLQVTWCRIEAGLRTLALGQTDVAAEMARLAHELMDVKGETFALSELYRLDAKLALLAGDTGAAEAHLMDALAFSNSNGGKLWGLRAAIEYARLKHDQGQGGEVAAVLRPIYESIADGDCVTERTEAAALLTRLSGER